MAVSALIAASIFDGSRIPVPVFTAFFETDKLGIRPQESNAVEVEEKTTGMQQSGILPNQSEIETMPTACKHPRVRIVSRHEDTEFVECLECGEVFDSEEFHDMEIEDSVASEEDAGS